MEIAFCVHTEEAENEWMNEFVCFSRAQVEAVNPKGIGCNPRLIFMSKNLFLCSLEDSSGISISFSDFLNAF